MPYEVGQLYYAKGRDELYKQDIRVDGFAMSHRPLRTGELVLYVGDRKVLVQDGVYHTLGHVRLTCVTLER